jgi:hypothetical protein
MTTKTMTTPIDEISASDNTASDSSDTNSDTVMFDKTAYFRENPDLGMVASNQRDNKSRNQKAQDQEDARNRKLEATISKLPNKIQRQISTEIPNPLKKEKKLKQTTKLSKVYSNVERDIQDQIYEAQLSDTLSDDEEDQDQDQEEDQDVEEGYYQIYRNNMRLLDCCIDDPENYCLSQYPHLMEDIQSYEYYVLAKEEEREAASKRTFDEHQRDVINKKYQLVFDKTFTFGRYDEAYLLSDIEAQERMDDSALCHLGDEADEDLLKQQAEWEDYARNKRALEEYNYDISILDFNLETELKEKIRAYEEKYFDVDTVSEEQKMMDFLTELETERAEKHIDMMEKVIINTMLNCSKDCDYNPEPITYDYNSWDEIIDLSDNDLGEDNDDDIYY